MIERMQNPDGDHDGEVLVKDFSRYRGDRGPTGKDFVYGAKDHKLSTGVLMDHPMRGVCEEASDRLEADYYEHNQVVARVWISGDREVSRIEWIDD